jgi:isocitrate dehydrogenase
LKGPLTTPVGGGFRSINVRLREEFGLYANVRPVRSMVSGGRFDDIDIVLVRENLGGFYVAFEHYIPIGGSARGRDFDRRQHPRGIAQDHRICIRLCAQERTQEGYCRSQGQRPEGIDRRVS